MANRLMAAALLLVATATARGGYMAYDDASDPVYNANFYLGQNGGFGFGPFNITSTNFSSTPMSVSSSSTNGPPTPDIDTAGRAWGNNANPTGNLLSIRRNLLADLPVGETYSVNYDNGDVDGRETIAFGAGANSACSFYFDGADANYKFVDTLSGVTTDTGIQQTFGGLSLALTRMSASTYSFQAVRLSDSATFNSGVLSYNTTLVPGIRTLLVINSDGGAGGAHAMFINSMAATPEPSCAAAISIALGYVISRRRRLGCVATRVGG